ncbi:MAG: hypothetical protein HY808_04605 [Nitrospirae bacterium]|nr:hypothetical protein [Nitrospirota bacterium]
MKSDDKNSKTYKLRFGEIAIMKGFLTTSQLEGALSEKIGYRPIGEIVLERGWMTLDQIDMVLEELNSK